MTFDAKLMQNGYLTSNNRAQYFKHLVLQDQAQPTLSVIPALYERVVLVGTGTLLPYEEFFTMYKPILQTANVNIPYICIFKGTNTLWDVVKDLSILRAYYTNNWFSTQNITTLNQLDNLVTLLKPFFETNGRKVKFISHSLGSYMALYTAWKLVSTSSSIRTSGLTQVHFAPYMLVTDAYEYFRDVLSTEYDSKANIKIYALDGDVVTGLVSTYGIGTVNKYTLSVSPIIPNPALDGNDVSVMDWLGEFANFPGVQSSATVLRSFKEGIAFHSLTNFNTDTVMVNNVETDVLLEPMISNYQEITAMPNYAVRGLSIQSQTQYDLTQWLDPSDATHPEVVNNQWLKGLMFTPNTPGTGLLLDYPHKVGGTNQPDELYGWYCSVIPGQKADYQLSTDANGVDRWVNFPLTLTNKYAPTNVYVPASIDLTLIKSPAYWSVVKPDLSISYGLVQFSTVQTNGLSGLSPITANSSAVVANMSAGNQSRYKWNVIEGWDHTNKLRRGLHAAPVYSGLRALFQSQYNGAYGYFNIKMENSEWENAGNTSPLYLYMEATGLGVYARPGNPTNFSQGAWGNYLDHNDNTTNPDEHVFLVEYVSGNLYKISSTILQNGNKRYIGESGGIYGSTSSVSLHSPPQLEITEDTLITTTDNYYMSLTGNNTDYPAFHYHLNVSGATFEYNYVDFYPLTAGSYYSIGRTKFKFEPI